MPADRDGTGKSRRLGRRTLLVGLGAVALARPAAAARGAAREIDLRCPETGERCVTTYWADGVYLPEAMGRIDWLMRDFHRGVVARIDPKLVDLLHAIRQRFGARHPIAVYSGFRTAETNDALREEGLAAAERSQHLIAHAADIAIPGVSMRHLAAAALRLRQGGVGFYANHVHVDTGPMRDWGGDAHRDLHARHRS